MKMKFWAMLFILILLAACAPLLGPYTDPGVPILVHQGDRFSIKLPSNATTGYSWDFGTPFDAGYLTLLKTDYKNPVTSLAGAGGTQVWVFKAIQSGSTSIRLEYKRPWEVNVPPVQTAQFDITIQ